MIGRTVLYVNKNTQEVVGKVCDFNGTADEALEMYRWGYNLRRGDPKYSHLPNPSLVEVHEDDVRDN